MYHCLKETAAALLQKHGRNHCCLKQTTRH